MSNHKTPKGAALAFVAERALGLDGEVCVDWPFQLRGGYGVVSTCRRPKRQFRSAHHMVLEAAGITQPRGATDVRHLCGRRVCVNLSHLLWGTRSENMLDRFRAHGDHNRGERNPRARLTDISVRDIRTRRLSQGEFAVLYGVSRATVSMAARGETWAHVDEVA